MYSIGIIGAGQLGSRHLQGLKTAKIEITIFVVDTDVNALNIARERYEEVKNNPLIQSIHFCTDLNGLPHSLDLVIIATGSLPRAVITKNLLQTCKVRYIVFEKVLFSSISEYNAIGSLLNEKGVKSWVNCPRRIFPFYKEIKELLQNSKNINFSVVGDNWGIGCNAIHFIDLFSWIVNDSSLSVNTTKLDKNIQKSKRNGYVEFTGTIEGRSTMGHSFLLKSQSEGTPTPIMSFCTDNDMSITINERDGMMTVDNEGEIVETRVNFPFQSQLTGAIVEEILLTGNSSLTTFEESSKIHLSFLEPLVVFYNKIVGHSSDHCPIT